MQNSCDVHVAVIRTNKHINELKHSSIVNSAGHLAPDETQMLRSPA